MAPLATVTAVVSLNVPDTVNVPALTVVVPVLVLAPDKVKVPEPVLTKFVAPVIASAMRLDALFELIVKLVKFDVPPH